MILIFSQLVAPDIARVATVSKGKPKWSLITAKGLHSIATNDLLWKVLYERKWGRGVMRKAVQRVGWKVLSRSASD